MLKNQGVITILLPLLPNYVAFLSHLRVETVDKIIQRVNVATPGRSGNFMRSLMGAVSQ